MKYKVGDQVVVKVEYQVSGKKRIVTRTPLSDSTIVEKTYTIVMKDDIEQAYSIVIDDDIIGWNINVFHIKYNHVDEKYLHKRFFDVTEAFILRKK
jgi:hypothetical protein